MIVAAGLTPAWQKILRFRALRLGEVNRATETAWCASGKVLNVGMAVATLGAACRVVSPVGGPAAATFRSEFASVGVTVDWIESQSPTRVCTTLIDDETKQVTELVENALPLAESELEAFREAYRRAAATADVVVLSGSLPAGVSPTFYRHLADDTPGAIVADVRGAELSALLAGPRPPFIVKPNREELAATVGRPLDDDADLHAAMCELNARGARWVVVTQGKHAVWVSSHAGLWRLSPPTIEDVVNPIGCGDSLAAGLAIGLAERRDPLDAVALGMAAAADNLARLLPARLQKTRVDQLAAGIRAERCAG